MNPQEPKNEMALSPLGKIKSDALRLLSVRPRSIEELRKRLLLKRHEPQSIEEVIAAFKQQGLLDDDKFAQLFATSLVYSRPASKKRIGIQLKQKGIPDKVISETLSRLEDYDETKTARELVANRFSRMSGLSPEVRKRRLFGFLKRRGYDNGVIFSVLKGLAENSEEAADDNG